jgi:hypothetical protein
MLWVDNFERTRNFSLLPSIWTGSGAHPNLFLKCNWGRGTFSKGKMTGE